MSTAKVIIAGENRIGSAVKSAQSDLSGFSKVAQKAGDALKNAFAITAVIAAVKKLGDALSTCFSDFNEADRKYRQLQLTLGKGDAYASVAENIKKLGKMTLEGKDSVESMVSELAALGKTPEEINRISDAAVALSNVTGKDLNSSMTTLLNTYRGTTTQLNKLGIDTSNLTKEQLANGAAVDLVTEKLYGLSEAMAKDDSSQHIKNIQDNLGDLGQSIGDLIDFSISPLLSKLDEFTTNAVSSFDGFIQRVKTVLGNLPEVMDHLWTAIKGGLSNLFSIDGIKTFVQNLTQVILNRIKLIGDAVADLISLVQGMAENLLKGIGNYAMYWITDICDSMGINISEVINSIGKWLLESPVGQVVDKVVTTAVNGIRLVGALIRNVPDMIKLVCSNAGTIISNLWITIKNSFFSTIKALFDNLAETLDRINFPQLIENLRVGISNLFGRIGAWFTAVGKTVKDTFRYIGDILKATFSWNSMKTMFTTLFKNIGVIASTTIKTIFQTIPGMIASLFEGIGKWIAYMAVHLKNSLFEAIQGFINDAGKKIQGTWVGKVFGLGDKLASVDFNIDRNGERNLKAEASASFSNIGSGFQKAITDAIDAAQTISDNSKAISDLYANIEGITEFNPQYEELTAAIKDSGAFVDLLSDVSDVLGKKIVDNSEEWEDIGKQFSALLNPVFEKFTTENSETIGQTMAKWTAKSSDEYYEAAKKNFKDIGTFLSDWGETFLSDMGDDWEGLTSSLSSVFGDAFGDDFDAFLEWFRPFMEEKLAASASTDQPRIVPTSTDESEGKTTTFIDNLGTKIGGLISDRFGVTETQGASAGAAVMDMAVESLGEAGTVAKELATNMATMGPVIGAIVTALKYVFEGFAEVFGGLLNEFVEYGLEPLREIGRVIGGLLIPILENLMPLVEQSAGSLIGLFDMIGMVLKPILQILGSALAPIIKVITGVLEALKPVLTVFAKVLVTITGTIQYVAQALQHWVAMLMNWMASLNLMGWQPFAGLKTDDPGAPGNYKSYIRNKWAEIDSAFDSQVSGATGTASTSTAVSSASYQGATQVTINIYQQAPVVGDGGMRTFAQMIKDQFTELDYYGVTT